MKHIQFYYVRHGETIFNVKNLSQGSCDSPLTKNGIHQAEKTKEKKKIFVLIRYFLPVLKEHWIQQISFWKGIKIKWFH